MTEDELIDAGYRKYQGPGTWSNADCFFQKCVRSPDRRARLYFVNVGMWDFRKYDHGERVGWEADGHFYRSANRSFRLAVPIEPGDSVADIEAVFAEFYARMGCVPDVHNQGE